MKPIACTERASINGIIDPHEVGRFSAFGRKGAPPFFETVPHQFRKAVLSFVKNESDD
jgi:hypothetical protein